jgi:anti-anti-sigma regulatory factor
MATSPPAIVVEAAALRADVSTIDALARLQLNAQRIGQSILLRGVPVELRRLIDLAGLGEVLRVEPGGQAEEREHALGVQEERQLLDPPA